jgi:hypothetical protein
MSYYRMDRFGGFLGLALLVMGVRSTQGAPAGTMPAEPDPPAYPGVAFGLRLGPGFLRANFDEASIGGMSYFLGVWTGFSITPRLTLSAELDKAHVIRPSSSYATRMDWLDLSAVGPDLKYYLSPDNVYVSGSVQLSRVSFKSDVPGYWIDPEQRSHWGASARLAVGKEWQASPRWRVGFEGEAQLGWMDYDPGGPDILVAVQGVSLAASVAYDGRAKQLFGPESRTRFYAEARVGVGMLRWRNSDLELDTVIDRTASAVVLPVAVAVGWAIAPRLILLGEFVDSHHREIETDAPGALEGVYSYGLGPGLKYYLDTTNLFAAGTLSWFKIDQTGWGNYGSSLVQHGLAVRLSFGREVWFSPHWSLGVSVEGLLARMSGNDREPYLAMGSELYTSLTYCFEPSRGEPSETVAPVPRPPSPGEHTHDGLYVGVRTGAGWLRHPAFSESDLAGWDWQLALAVGVAITPRVVLFGELAESQVWQPGGMGPVDFNLVAVGPGLTYYLDPSNFFLSASLGVSQFGWRAETMDTRYGGSGSTRGLTGRFSVGKEWWVSSNWGLGLAAEALLAKLGDGSASGASLQAVASFN